MGNSRPASLRGRGPAITIAHRVAVALLCSFCGCAAGESEPSEPAGSGVGAFAPNGLIVQVGRTSNATTLGLGLQWNWSRSWRLGEHGRLSGYNNVLLGRWRVDDGASAIVTQVGFTPAFRFWPRSAAHGWFFEGGIGANWLTPLYRTRDKRFSTAFNFGDHLAVGHRSALLGWEWSLRVQHFSNAGIREPNPGENFVQLRLVVPLGGDA